MRLKPIVLLAAVRASVGAAEKDVLLRNAAMPGVRYPAIGLGLHGSGFEIPKNLQSGPQCWHFPTCCTREYCPSVNATREWLRRQSHGGTAARLDTGYPYGDGSPFWGPVRGTTCGGWNGTPIPTAVATATATEASLRRTLGHWCDPHGIRAGIEQSGLSRDRLFITIKSGFAGPMQEINKGYLPKPLDYGQAEYQLNWLGLEYADLYLMHQGDLGNTGMWPAPYCSFPTTPACRLRVWNSCLDWMKQNKTRACGVANWTLEWLEDLVRANTTLPSVLQTKFHVHQSLSSPRIKALKAFCDKHKILFTGYSPLGRADWTRFEKNVGVETLLQEPAVKSIAARLGKSPAQVLLRWHVKLGIPTQARTMNTSHMDENLDIFTWEKDLDAADMDLLGRMKQCNVIRGDSFVEGDPEDQDHEYRNMIGPTLHC